MLVNYCKNSADKGACCRDYMITMTVLLILHTIVDYGLYRTVRIKYEAFEASTNSGGTTEFEMKNRV